VQAASKPARAVDGDAGSKFDGKVKAGKCMVKPRFVVLVAAAFCRRTTSAFQNSKTPPAVAF
jgi:hypothetical protein